MLARGRGNRSLWVTGDDALGATDTAARRQVVSWALLRASIGLAVALSAWQPAVAADQTLGAIGFERPLRANQLLRTWHRQVRSASDAQAVEGAAAPMPKPTIVTLTSKPPRLAIRTPKLTGRLAERRARYTRLIEAAAERHRLDPELIHAVVRAESSYDPNARSSAGACGLMQLMPATAQRFGVRDVWDPAQNIAGGVAYLRVLIERFEGDLRLVLAAYNAGEGAVAKYGNRIPPYRETQHYVRRVLGYLGQGSLG